MMNFNKILTQYSWNYNQNLDMSSDSCYLGSGDNEDGETVPPVCAAFLVNTELVPLLCIGII